MTEDELATNDEPEEIRFEITQQQCGVRLDQAVKYFIPDISRSLISLAISCGSLVVNGESKKRSYKVREGDVIFGTLLSQPPLQLDPEYIPLTILFEDDAILVLSKPPGLVVHPGSGNKSGTLANGLVYYYDGISGIGSTIRPGLVHRLDKDTSGVLVVAKTETVHRRLVEQFKNRTVHKEYLALVKGRPKEEKGTISAPIARHPVNRQKMSVQYENGRHAISHYEVLDSFEVGYSLLTVSIETGRTHQIRVHCAYMGHPVAGDAVYGGSSARPAMCTRQMLHAFRLRLNHPVTDKEYIFQAPLWADFSAVLDLLAGYDYSHQNMLL